MRATQKSMMQCTKLRAHIEVWHYIKLCEENQLVHLINTLFENVKHKNSRISSSAERMPNSSGINKSNYFAITSGNKNINASKLVSNSLKLSTYWLSKASSDQYSIGYLTSSVRGNHQFHHFIGYTLCYMIFSQA